MSQRSKGDDESQETVAAASTSIVVNSTRLRLAKIHSRIGCVQARGRNVKTGRLRAPTAEKKSAMV
jgi:hypothetical protein